jgi:hypothetical protein
MGCSYTSDYVPPKDGRARAIWKDDKAVVAAPSELPDCATREQPPEGYRYEVPLDAGGYYYAPSGTGHVHVGVVVIGRPPILLPGVPGVTIPSPGNVSGDGAEYLVVILAVGAIVAFPFIAMGLALGHPEPEDEVAAAIDQVNAFNDESRERLAKCAAWYRKQREAAR